MSLGKDKHGILFSVFLLMSASALSQDAVTCNYVFDGFPAKFAATEGSQSMIIDYAPGELDILSMVNDNGTYYRLSIPGHIPSTDAGRPEVPVFCRMITLPDAFEYKIRITDIRKEKIIPSRKKIKGLLYPAQEGATKNLLQAGKQLFIDKSIYSTKGIIASDTVTIERIGTSRGQKLAGLYIYPVRYNPVDNYIEVITSMKIEIIYTAGGKGSLSLVSAETAISQQLSKRAISDYDQGKVIPGFSTKPVKMVIITDTAFKKQLLPFFKWKTDKGFNLKILYKGAKFAGTTYTQLKDTLTKIYKSATSDDPAPEYLLIIGDVNRIPRCDVISNVSDMYYGEFDGGGDYIPEMYIGRLPVSDTNDVKAVVSKLIQYERFEFADTNSFYSRALISAGNDAVYQTTMNGQLNYVLSNYLNSSNKINEYHFYYPQSGDAGVEDSIKFLFKKGISFVNYTGHGDVTGWLDPVLKNKDVDSLKNSNMYPFIITNACRTSQFSSSASLGNRMILAKDKGAIGYIGCSNDSYWDEDFFWAVGAGTVSINPTYQSTGLGAYDRLFHTHGELPSDWYFTMGQINYAGNMAVSASTSTRKQYYWETYNLLGDPSVIPILGKPSKFSTVVPDTLPNGMKLLSMTAEPFSYVALSRADTLWDATNASKSGSVELTMPGLSNDSCLMVITGQNRIPVIKTIRIANVKGEYVSLAANSINDSSGNNDKKVDSGETFFLDLTVSNLGLTDASGLYAKITGSSDYLSIITDSVNIGALQARTDKKIQSQFRMTVSGDIPDLSVITVDLMLKDNKTEKHFKIDLCIHAPDPLITNCMVNDSIIGNRNNSADPGETFYLIFKVMNNGSSNTTGHLTITSNNPAFTILEPEVTTTVPIGIITSVPVKVKLDDSPSNGEYINVTADLDCSPYGFLGNFTFRVGKLRESFESMNFKAFPWINISKVPWIITSKEAYEGTESARSGAISHSSSTSLIIRTLYKSDDSVKFYYKVSSEPNYDNFTFKLNDAEMLKASGEISWTRAAFKVPEGINRMEWTYRKDQSVSNGYDAAWIDLIDFAESGFISYIQNDLEVARIVSPIEKNRYGQEIVTVRVLNLGRDTIKEFNLAYLVNSGSPVTQKFDKTILPLGDSVTVSFSTRTNLSRYGKYDILTYSFNNPDDYLYNDSLSVRIENSHMSDSSGVYPNPFTDKFNVYIRAGTSDRIIISLISITGETEYEFEREIIPGSNNIELNCPRSSSRDLSSENERSCI